MRSLADRNRPIPCKCGNEKRRVVSAPAGLHRFASEAEPGPATPAGRPNVTMTDCEIDNCGGGVLMDGGIMAVDGLKITNTPVGIELRHGARGDFKNIEFRANAGKQRSRSQRRSEKKPGQSEDRPGS